MITKIKGKTLTYDTSRIDLFSVKMDVPDNEVKESAKGEEKTAETTYLAQMQGVAFETKVPDGDDTEEKGKENGSHTQGADQNVGEVRTEGAHQVVGLHVPCYKVGKRGIRRVIGDDTKQE